MKTKHLYWSWLVLYLLCAGLGFLPQRNAFVHIVLSLFFIGFYIPGIMLLHRGITAGDQKLLRQVRCISLCVLVLTLLMIVVNILAVHAGNTAGVVLNAMLMLVSVPMYCCYWPGIGLFLWACLFIGSFPRLWRK